MTKKFKFVALVALSVVALTALGAGIVSAQVDNGEAWNPSVSQTSAAVNCGNGACDGECDGECDGLCDGNCSGDCTGGGNCFKRGQSGSYGEGGNCGQFVYRNGGKQNGCRGGGCS